MEFLGRGVWFLLWKSEQKVKCTSCLLENPFYLPYASSKKGMTSIHIKLEFQLRDQLTDSLSQIGLFDKRTKMQLAGEVW